MYTFHQAISSIKSRKYVLLPSLISVVAGLCLGFAYSKYAFSQTQRSFHQLMEEAMTAMDRGMKEAPMTGDPDHDFAAMMIPHHQGAIDMAKAELLYGKNPTLRRLAQEIIVTQDSEIKVMERELSKYTRSHTPNH